jgi:lysozyme
MSEKGIEMLTAFEGLQTHSYLDSAGIWSIGVGHIITKADLAAAQLSWSAVSKLRWTREHCLQVFAAELSPREERVSALMPGGKQHQFDAVLSFCFNVGFAWVSSPYRQAWLAFNRFDLVAAVMKRYDHAGGERVRGLTLRRAAEIRLLTSGVYPG